MSQMAKPKNAGKPTKQIYHNQNQNHQNQKPDKPPSWLLVRGLLPCKDQKTQHIHQQKHQQPQQQKQEHRQKKHHQTQEVTTDEITKKCKKMKCSGSLCSNTKVVHRPETFNEVQRKKAPSMALISSSSDASNRSMRASLKESSSGVISSANLSFSASSNASSVGSFRGMPFRRFSGCYECRMVVDPVLGFARDPSLRSSICSCPDCGEIFVKPENLELHRAVRHAVSELGPDDTSKNIVEIIFQSSWIKKQPSICKIDRILKVQNTQRTISKFEEYRDSIKAKATKLPKKYPRCIADGNELLRFYCTSFACTLGLNGSSNLCNSTPHCNICSIIKNGFKEASTGGVKENGILTTATSGKAHDKAAIFEVNNNGNCDKRAMLVCRVIAGRVKKMLEGGANMEDYDSVAGELEVYSNLDELYVFNPKAILPCFVVIYSGF